ncbi:MAG TPA: helix-turn-helix transcriptional regulator [Fodinibius sp.]|nr:helix-turn-helix transcriptional regulator [Fodinibius sp.]
MMNKKEKIEGFLANVEDDGGQWIKKARYRRANHGWLRKSQEVAIKVLQTLDEKDMQQKELAEAMDVSPQQVSKIVKGKQNLALQTITKLEQVLGISLFEVPQYPNTQKIEKNRY